MLLARLLNPWTPSAEVAKSQVKSSLFAVKAHLPTLLANSSLLAIAQTLLHHLLRGAWDHISITCDYDYF